MTPLRAGPLTLGFLDGDLRRIALGGLEVARRIYFALRDRNWVTIPGRIEDLRLRRSADSFEIRYRCTHLAGDIDFRWEARITGDRRGTVRFEAAGRAYSEFLRNRIGLCVHHPLRECAGLRVQVNGRQGEFPRLVAPHQPLTDFRRLRYSLLPGLDAEFHFEGETFETEDHRNWGDANYKTYGTPLALPFPVRVRKGDEVRQAVTLRLEGPVPDPLPERAEPRLHLPQRWRPMPPIGFMYSGGRIPLELAPAHLRVDLGAGQRPPALPVPLELAVHLEPGRESEQLRALSDVRQPLARLLIFHRSEKVTNLRWIEQARTLLRGAPVVGGTDMWFAELNRERPALPAPPVAFALCPQVHASDELSLIENLEAFPQMLETAHSFLKGAPVHVTPITLKPRFNPVATDPAAPFDNTDPRQASPFLAAWTLGALASLLEAGPASLTFYETSGARGLLGDHGPYPVYRLFEALAGYHPAEFATAGIPGALWLRRGSRQALFVANLCPEPRQIELPQLPGLRGQVRLLGEQAAPLQAPGRHTAPAWGVLLCEWEMS